MDGLTEFAIKQAAESFRTMCDSVSTLITSVQPLVEMLVEEAESERKPPPVRPRPTR